MIVGLIENENSHLEIVFKLTECTTLSVGKNLSVGSQISPWAIQQLVSRIVSVYYHDYQRAKVSIAFSLLLAVLPMTEVKFKLNF